MKDTEIVFSRRERVSEMWVKQIGQSLAKKFKVTVKKGKGWSADVDKGVLTYGPEIHELSHNQALGILSHEISHLLHTKHPTETEISKQFPELRHQAVNMLEDHRIEYLMGEKFIGAKEAIGFMHEGNLRRYADSLEKNGDKLIVDLKNVSEECVSRNLPAIGSVSELQRLRATPQSKLSEDEQRQQDIARSYGNGEYIPVATQILLAASMMNLGEFPYGYPSPEVNDIAKQISDKMNIADVKRMPSTQAVADFFEAEIYPLMSEYFTPAEEKQQQRTQQGPATEKSEQRKKKTKEGAEDKTEEMQKEIADMVEKATGHRPPFGRKEHRRSEYRGFDYKKTATIVGWEVGTKVNALKRILKDNSFDRYGGRFLTGRLNARKLYKHRLGDYRLFSRKLEKNKKEFDFVLNVDISGSMQDYSRMANAQKATVLLTELLLKAGMNVGITTFGNRTYTVKGLQQPLDTKKITDSLTTLENATDLVGGVKTAIKLISKEATGKPIVITITDGNLYSHTKREVRMLVEKNRHIDFYGVCLASYDLTEAFRPEHSFQLTDTSKLLDTMLIILKRHIK